MENKIKDFAERINTLKSNLDTEEATKTALIMPFFNLLEYDVFNPSEFIPEFTCDVGIKKGEKIDYAIKKDEKIIMIIEAKKTGYDLNKVDSQLIRYFHTTDARIAIMTDGIKYKFYSDLDKSNVMDNEPFFEFDLENLNQQQILDIDKFRKSKFDVTDILSLASNMRTIDLLKDSIYKEFSNPSTEFVKLLINEIHEGIKTKQITDTYSIFIKKAFNQLVNDKVTQRLNDAIHGIDIEEEVIEEPTKKKIITTDDELLSFQIIKSILAEHININRIYYRDTESYFGILLDNNGRKWICRVKFVKDGINVYFNDNSHHKISDLNDLFSIKQLIIDCLNRVI